MSKIDIKFVLVAAVLAISTIVSCTKENEKFNVPDVTFPKVSVTTPEKFSSKTSQAPIHIVGNVTDNLLKTLNVKVINLLDSSVILNNDRDVNGKKGFTFNESFSLNTAGNIVPCALIISAKDAANHLTVDNTNFVVN